MSNNPEYDKLVNDPNLSEKTLQETLNAYRLAMEQEFKMAAEKAETAESVQELTRDFFKENCPHAAAQIAWLAMNADGESVRLRASQYIIERGLKDSADDGDPIKALLNELKQAPTKPKPTSMEGAQND
jgi:hypothetical protein